MSSSTLILNPHRDKYTPHNESRDNHLKEGEFLGCGMYRNLWLVLRWLYRLKARRDNFVWVLILSIVFVLYSFRWKFMDPLSEGSSKEVIATHCMGGDVGISFAERIRVTTNLSSARVNLMSRLCKQYQCMFCKILQYFHTCL